MEKSKGLCRQLVLPTIDDALVLQRLSDNFFASIRGKTPTAYAFFEPDNFAFSKGNRSGYGSFAAWLHFQNKVFELCSDKNYIVTTDISNYYDHIGYTSLRNVISSTVSVTETILDLLVHALAGLTWQPDYMPRVEMGLPQIDLDAPRVLAHSFLFDLDRYAKAKVGDRYTRFMDDINFGVDSISEAKEVLRDVDLILHTRQVRLNSGKTHILTADQAKKHFCVADHEFLDTIQRDLRLRKTLHISTEDIKSDIESVFSSYERDASFDQGHGEKILKRLLTIAKQSKSGISSSTISDILRRRPGSREYALSYISQKTLNLRSARIISEFLRNPEIIDDVPFLIGPTTLVEMKASSRVAIKSVLGQLIDDLSRRDRWQLYGAIWILSKYGSREAILELLVRRRLDWISDPVLGRLVGGIVPLFVATAEFAQFMNLVVGSGNSFTASAVRFHNQVAGHSPTFWSLRRYLLATNPSRPTAITHEKFLTIISVFKSTTVPENYKKELLTRHAATWRDAFYRRTAIESLPTHLRSLAK